MHIIDKILNWYFTKSSLPYWCILLLDSVIIYLSGLATYWAFNRGVATIANFPALSLTLCLYIAISFIGFRLFRTYSGIVRYSSFVDLQRVAFANMLSMVIVLIVNYFVRRTSGVGIIHLLMVQIVMIYFIATTLMWAMRVLVKLLHDVTTMNKRAKRTLIYGIQEGGVGLAKNIRMQNPLQFQLKGFISHETGYKHHVLMGERVYEVNDQLADTLKALRIETLLVSPMRNKEFRNDQALQDLLINAGVKIYMVENAKEWSAANNIFKPDMLKEVSVEDLLPREEITIDMESVGSQLKGQRILITGSAGSIGSELVRQIASFSPAAMMLIDQAETPQHDVRLMMAHDWPAIPCETVVTSITKPERMDHVFSTFKPDYVFHAAAYKHVPMMEDNPCESIQNNVYGTKVIADLSVKYGVKKFVMVSTDKAVNPTNVMGCSKRICEIYVQSLNNTTDTTQFVTTRFGNVLGSNGSVIPLFQEQIRKGGPVTVTHPDIIRYFMLISEACKLVLEASTKGHGGEIFVFDMGQPVRIADLAYRMIKLSGSKNIKVEYTGLREGEKLYEEVLSNEEDTMPSFHKKIRIARVREYDFAEVNKDIDALFELSKRYDDLAIVKKMMEIVPEYQPNNTKYAKL